MGGLSYSGGWNITYYVWDEGQTAGFPFGRILLNERHPIRKPSIVIILLNCTNHFKAKSYICLMVVSRRPTRQGLWCQAFINFQ
eukprot:11554185-Ditylum_brightwellii.AAC.1